MKREGAYEEFVSPVMGWDGDGGKEGGGHGKSKALEVRNSRACGV